MIAWEPGRRLLTVREAASSVGRPQSTVRYWLHKGWLSPAAHRGSATLILESELLELDAQLARPKPRIRHAHRVA